MFVKKSSTLPRADPSETGLHGPSQFLNIHNTPQNIVINQPTHIQLTINNPVMRQDETPLKSEMRMHAGASSQLRPSSNKRGVGVSAMSMQPVVETSPEPAPQRPPRKKVTNKWQSKVRIADLNSCLEKVIEMHQPGYKKRINLHTMQQSPAANAKPATEGDMTST